MRQEKLNQTESPLLKLAALLDQQIKTRNPISPNILGEALFDISKALMRGVFDGVEERIEKLKKRWRSLTKDGQMPAQEIFGGEGEVAAIQKAIEDIQELRQYPDSFTFYIPEGGGVVRLTMAIGQDNKANFFLDKRQPFDRVSENFDNLIKSFDTEH